MEAEIRRSKRKSVSITITGKAEVIVRAPLYMTESEIREVLRRRADWIAKHVRRMQEQIEKRRQLPPIPPEEISRLADEAVRRIPERVRFFAPLVGVTYGRITIRNQKTRWGSCSSKGNLNFNCLLMMTPPEIQDYVVDDHIRQEKRHYGGER